MQIFVKTDDTIQWWVFCLDPRFNIGPLPSGVVAFEVKEALEKAHVSGQEHVRGPLRALLGL